MVSSHTKFISLPIMVAMEMEPLLPQISSSTSMTYLSVAPGIWGAEPITKPHTYGATPGSPSSICLTATRARAIQMIVFKDENASF